MRTWALGLVGVALGVTAGCSAPRNQPPPADGGLEDAGHQVPAADGIGPSPWAPEAAPTPSGTGGAPAPRPDSRASDAREAAPALDASAPEAADGCPGSGCPPLAAAVKLTAGHSHTCAILADRTTHCWGSNERGQLGSPANLAQTPIPTLVQGLAGATALAGGLLHTCALVAEGRVACWGDNSLGQLGDGSKIDARSPVMVVGVTGATTIAAGCDHTCVVMPRGELRCWGSNQFAQIGDQTMVEAPAPRAVVGLPPASAVGASCNHTCAVVAGGAIHCWGGNLGRVPEQVPGVADAQAVVGGGQTLPFSCALSAMGRVTCWDEYLGSRPAVVFFASGATAIGVGNGRACAIIASQVHCRPDGVQPPAVVAGLMGGASAVALGRDHTCVIVSGGKVRCWGEGTFGQNGATSNSPTPIAVPGW